MGLRQRAATSKVSGLRMGGDRLPDGPAGRGAFTKDDTFILPDGRAYQPGDTITDQVYADALESPVIIGDDKKSFLLGAGLLGFSIIVPTILIKVVMGM
eukprot:CAMPEP_0179457174 /NCGR_PEP_ID=MMETSP0799-20121207/41022_1 /TAXON_ID=46947 /ORGANISM="Geminigera cryophila, Strain CCMP2564" /LENGTH=98 /DNA_ID=CAMNT_0021257757 /DNA_START=86 /DNA_END=382 /DNA_ORIENTATION=-